MRKKDVRSIKHKIMKGYKRPSRKNHREEMTKKREVKNGETK